MRYNQLMESTTISVRDLNLPPDFWKSGRVKLQARNLDSLDGCPDEILGDFICWNNNLTSLAGGPKIVSGEFHCMGNQLTSLAGAPNVVNGDFNCVGNQLTSLEYYPTIVGGDFDCENNQLTSLTDIHKHIRQMNGKLDIGGNPIISHLLGILLIQGCKEVSTRYRSNKTSPLLQQAIDILNRYLGRGRAGIMDCQAEMIAAGLDDFAQI